VYIADSANGVQTMCRRVNLLCQQRMKHEGGGRIPTTLHNWPVLTICQPKYQSGDLFGLYLDRSPSRKPIFESTQTRIAGLQGGNLIDLSELL
jgi:hypothetical protein